MPGHELQKPSQVASLKSTEEVENAIVALLPRCSCCNILCVFIAKFTVLIGC
jgi:hypothetical protein